MKAIIFFGCLLCLEGSCVIKRYLPGQYISKGKDYSMNLTVNKDSSFVFLDDAFEVHKVGKGRWRLKGNDTLLLKCRNYNSGIFLGITQDYLDGDELKFLVLKNGRLKYFRAILKKVN